MSKRQFLSGVIFLLLAAAALFGCSKIAFQNLRAFNNHEGFYECGPGTIDVIFIGGSMSYTAFSPIELYEKHGISSYNLGTSNQSMLAGYIWALEAGEYHDYKAVVVEAMAVPMSHGDIATDIRSLYSMGINHNYLRLAGVYKRNFYKVLFPVFILHDGWKINEDTFRQGSDDTSRYMRGYLPVASEAGEKYQDPIVRGDETATAYLKFPYLDRLREYCDDNGIQLILVKTLMASNEINHWEDGQHNRLQEYADQYNIPFFDFNTAEYIEAAGLNIATDVAADLRHMNIRGAQKVTDYIGKYLLQLDNIDIRQYENPEMGSDVIEEYHRIIEEIQASEIQLPVE